MGSTLKARAIEHMRDKSWLKIICNRNVPVEHGNWSRHADDEDGLSESSVQMFSRDLARMSKRFPERFGRLALRFPSDVHPSYVGAALEGLKESQPKDVPEGERAGWKPASVELIEAVLTRFSATDDRETANTFCWLLHDRADEQWSGDIIAFEELAHWPWEPYCAITRIGSTV